MATVVPCHAVVIGRAPARDSSSRKLARELGQIVTVIDRPLAEALARTREGGAIAADDRHRRRIDPRDEIEVRPSTRHLVTNDVYSVHSEHPFFANRRARRSATGLQGPR